MDATVFCFLIQNSILNTLEFKNTPVVVKEKFSDESSLYDLFRKYAKNGSLYTASAVIIDATKNTYDEIIPFLHAIEEIGKKTFNNTWYSFLKKICVLLPENLTIKTIDRIGIASYYDVEAIEDFLALKNC